MAGLTPFRAGCGEWDDDPVTDTPDPEAAIPDLTAIPLEQLAELGGSPLARSIALYRERLAQDGETLNSFSGHI